MAKKSLFSRLKEGAAKLVKKARSAIAGGGKKGGGLKSGGG